MDINKNLPLRIYKNGELVAQSAAHMTSQHKDWFEHYISHYPKANISEKPEGGSPWTK